jgi:hypothetical protein
VDFKKTDEDINTVLFFNKNLLQIYESVRNINHYNIASDCGTSSSKLFKFFKYTILTNDRSTTT